MCERRVELTRRIPLALLAFAQIISIVQLELPRAVLVPAAHRAVELLAAIRCFAFDLPVRVPLDDDALFIAAARERHHEHREDGVPADHRFTVPGKPANPLPLMYGASDVVW